MNSKETTFYKELQECEGLDLRDARGRVHDLGYILILFMISILRGKDGNMSSIHRGMKNKHKDLSNSLSIAYDEKKVISRSYLPVFLKKINGSIFSDLFERFYGVELESEKQQWFGGDGKELRGSIEKGDKRGDAIVGLVEHKTNRIACFSYYSGKKESEKTCLEDLIEKQQMWSSNLTFDALHLSPTLTSKIEQSSGTYIIGLKGNQGILNAQMELHTELEIPTNTFENREVGHGRIEERYYESYDIQEVLFDKRWSNSGFKTLFKVRRKITENKTGKQSDEIRYYISNGQIDITKKTTEANLYFETIRNHWSCEVTNHYRDVTLKEDHLKTKYSKVTKTVASIRSLIINALLINKPKNMAALLDDFNDNFDYLIAYLKAIRFL